MKKPSPMLVPVCVLTAAALIGLLRILAGGAAGCADSRYAPLVVDSE